MEFLYLPYTKKNIAFLKKVESGELNKKRQEGFLTAIIRVIKKDHKTSIRNHANELKVDEELVIAAIKQF